MRETVPVTWSDEKLILLLPRSGFELTPFRSPWRQHDQGVLRANHSTTTLHDSTLEGCGTLQPLRSVTEYVVPHAMFL